MRLLVTCAEGLSSLLAEELLDFGVIGRPEGDSALSVEGDWSAFAKIALRSRLASRILLSLKIFSARNQAMLYDQVRRIDWSAYLKVESHFAVFCHGRLPDPCDFKLSFAPLKIKDAICDEFKKRAQTMERPSIDRKNPDLRIEAFFNEGQCELSLDLIGFPLHQRGYRVDTGPSPLRENKAAALLRLVGYTGQAPLHDPFCGSGTLAIEAALIAMKRAPGLLREPIESFRQIFQDALPFYKDESIAAQNEMLEAPPFPIVASDISATALLSARKNIRALELSQNIQTLEMDARDLIAEKESFIVCNPPYGERQSEQRASETLMKDWGYHLKHKVPGIHLGVILADGPVQKALGFKSKRYLRVSNGGIPAKIMAIEIF